MLRKCIILALLTISVTGMNLSVLPSNLTTNNDVISVFSENIARKFSEEYMKFMKTGKESIVLKRISSQLAKSHSRKNIFSTSLSELGPVDQFFFCTTCRATINVIVETFRADDGELNGPNAESNTKKVVLKLCNRFNIQTPEVCSGLLDINWPIMHYIIKNSTADSRLICATLPIAFCKIGLSNFNWTIQIDNAEYSLTAAKSEIPKKTDNDFTIVHLADIHLDTAYQPGSLADCEEPLCCRKMLASKISEESQAGYWGDYRSCDSPLHMVKNAFDHIRATYKKIDYIYQTGDIVAHNVWSTTKEGNKATLTILNDLIAEKFPDIPVYPCIGNHEPHPVNIFGHENVPPELNVGWLYEHLWTNWQRWLPAEAKVTILKGGYYTVSPTPGLRIISLNSNACYSYNWWIYYDGNVTSQPQLDWLQKTLLTAEKMGEHVHILIHIPSGHPACWNVWAREYNRIIERYSHIISGIFGGHTHKDEVSLHYSKNGHAMAIFWNGGSLTPFSYKNPNYRIYDVEPTTYQVVDHHTWIFNLSEANRHGGTRYPQWFKEYQFTDFTDDLSPAGINALIERMVETPSLLRQYWKYAMTSSDPKIRAGCNEYCLANIICRLVTTINNEMSRCKELKAKLMTSLAIEETTVAPTEKPETESDGAASMSASINYIVVLLVIIYHLI